MNNSNGVSTAGRIRLVCIGPPSASHAQTTCGVAQTLSTNIALSNPILILPMGATLHAGARIRSLLIDNTILSACKLANRKHRWLSRYRMESGPPFIDLGRRERCNAVRCGMRDWRSCSNRTGGPGKPLCQPLLGGHLTAVSFVAVNFSAVVVLRIPAARARDSLRAAGDRESHHAR